MAVENLGKCVTVPSSGDLSSAKYKFVTVNSSGQVATTGDGAQADGVLQNDPGAAGRAATVMVGVGISKVVAGGTVTRGGDVGSDSSGRAVDAASGDAIVGQALEAATTAGQVITLLFKPKAGTL
jgi:hypothetical protein